MAKLCCDSPIDYQLKSAIQKWKCSKCGSEFIFTTPPLDQNCHFCPCCGEKMDGYDRTDNKLTSTEFMEWH